MGYKLRWDKGNSTFESNKTFRTKAAAVNRAKFMRQMDDDLPKSKREKSLKTFRVVKAIKRKKIGR